MELGLAGKAAIITGGSKGIGRATALALTREGVDVAISAREAEPLQAASREIAEATGQRVIGFQADMKDPEAVKRFVDQAAEQLGRLDIVVNSVGAAPYGNFLDVPDEVYLDSFLLKYMGAVRTTRAAIPYLRRAGGGAIINIAGTAGKEPEAASMLAGLNNAAMMNLTKSLSRAFAAENIRTLVICPGPVATQRWDGLRRGIASREGISEEEAQRRVTSTIPLGRIAEAEDVANLVVFLASDAARHLTGIEVTCDGGQTRAL